MPTNPAVFTARAEDEQQQGWDAKAQKQQMQIAPLTLALTGMRARLANAADPNDPTKPLQGKEDEYTAAHDGMADIIGKIRTIINPPPKEDPHGLGYLVHRATDKLHITRSAVADANAASEKKLRQYRDETLNDTTSQIQSIAPDASANFSAEYQKATGKPPTPEMMDEFARKQAGILPKPVPETSDTRARKDYDNDHTRQPDETFEQWKARQSVVGRNTAKVGHLKFEKTTRQVVDEGNGKRYGPNDANNPPEVAAMFRDAAQTRAAEQRFQEKMAALRGKSYNLSRPMKVLDTQDGMAPKIVDYGDIKKSPDRYVDATEGDKAMRAENLMQDISGTSKATRRAIMSLPDSEAFTNDQKLKILAAMRADDPHQSTEEFIGQMALGSLTDKQQDFLVSTRQLAENAMAMRSVLGAGQGSDDMRRAITATLPGLLSPNRSFALKQLDAFDATINRLHRGVPKIKLNETPMKPQDGGASKGIVSVAAAMKKPKYAKMTKEQVKNAITTAGYTPTD